MLQTFRKIVELFDARERLRLAGLLGASVFMGMAQLVGVASIMPFLALVADPSVVHTNDRLSRIYDAIGFESDSQFLVAVGVGVLGMMALTNGVAAATSWLIVRFTWDKHRSLSVRMLVKYLNEPYTFYLSRNTAKLSKNILAEVTAVVSGVLVPALKMMAQAVVVVFITLLLIVIDPVLAAVSAGVLGGLYGALYLAIRRKQLRLGRVRLEAGTVRFKSAQDALVGIKDVKVLGREADFVRSFSAASRKYSRTQASNAIISEIPRFALETVAFGGILLVVLYALTSTGDPSDILPKVGLYAFAAYKLKPALQAIFNAMAKIRFNAPSLEVLHADLRGAPRRSVDGHEPATSRMHLERQIEVSGMSFRYPSSEDWVLRDVDLCIPKNAMVGIVGTTGSGKTTLVDILLGLLEPQQGEILVDGTPITAENIRAWRRTIGYVPQHIFLMDRSARQNIAFGIPEAEIDQPAVERAARIANIHEFIVSLPDGYDTIVGDRGLRLSGGQRQRIGIARALYHDPELLVLDEATSALDGVTEDGVMQAIRSLAKRKTIILIAHRLTTLRECDTIYMFDQGRLMDQGPFQHLLAANPHFQDMARLSSGAEAIAEVADPITV